MSKRTRLCFVGFGGMARHHVRSIIKQLDKTEIAAVCEPSEQTYQQGREIFEEQGLRPPPNFASLDRLLESKGADLDVAFILTPHVYHFEQAKACLKAGLDVLLEKPMVMNALEAADLIAVRDMTGRKLVVAFQGGLSPAIRKAAGMLRSGEHGELLSISGTVWQGWGPNTVGKWRQDPAVSGGGFMFDTGAHMLNTICDLAGEDFVQVAAWLDNRGRPVDVMAAVMGRLKSGGLVTIHGCGETTRSCASDIRIFTTRSIMKTGQWGETLEIYNEQEREFQEVPLPAMLDTWEQFLKVRSGEIENPCPPEVGLRMAKLWDAIKASAAQNGQPVHLAAAG